MQIKTVTIIGGGSSGWMTAAALAKLCPHLKITLIESPTIGTVGVGESTLGHINKFFNLLELKDEDLKGCRILETQKNRFGGSGHTVFLNLARSGFAEVARISNSGC